MRVVWRDTSDEKKTKKYRGYKVYGEASGWCIDYPDDNNVYKSWVDAFNAIDILLGGHGSKGPSIKKYRGGEPRILGVINE